MAAAPAFEEWLKWVFDHPVTEPEWHWSADPWLEPPRPVALDFLTKTFEDPNRHLAPYSDAQVDQGLNLLISPACSSHFFAFVDETIPLEKRLRGIRSFVPLFRDFFAARCSPHLSHLDEAGVSPLNGACYMWWDVAPIHGNREGAGFEAIADEIFRVMEASLRTESVACQESALHGLGHWAIYDRYRGRCERMVDDFLRAARSPRPELVRYAGSARAGRVL